MPNVIVAAVSSVWSVWYACVFPYKVIWHWCPPWRACLWNVWQNIRARHFLQNVNNHHVEEPMITPTILVGIIICADDDMLYITYKLISPWTKRPAFHRRYFREYRGQCSKYHVITDRIDRKILFLGWFMTMFSYFMSKWTCMKKMRFSNWPSFWGSGMPFLPRKFSTVWAFHRRCSSNSNEGATIFIFDLNCNIMTYLFCFWP